jgi:hypothetical protein
MSKKIKALVFVLGIVILASYLSGCGKKTNENQNSALDTLAGALTGETAFKQGQVAEKNLAIAEARNLFSVKKAEEIDMSTGPCLSNKIIEDWVFDIAHNPRQEIDNEPENQCSAYREGKAHHFVEFDPEGNLIRAE